MSNDQDAKEATDAVDDAVAEHHVEQKRLLGDLLQKGKELLGAAVDKIKGVLSSVSVLSQPFSLFFSILWMHYI